MLLKSYEEDSENENGERAPLTSSDESLERQKRLTFLESAFKELIITRKVSAADSNSLK